MYNETLPRSAKKSRYIIYVENYSDCHLIAE
jgi:hypothetical protein